MNRLPEFPNVEGQNSTPSGIGAGSKLASKLRMLVMSAIASGGVVGANGCLPELGSVKDSCYVAENVGICLELCTDFKDDSACDIYCDVVTEEIYEDNKNAKIDDVRFPKCEQFIEADGFGGIGGNMDMGGDMRTDAFDAGDAEPDAELDLNIIIPPFDMRIVDADLDANSRDAVFPLDAADLGVDFSDADLDMSTDAFDGGVDAEPDESIVLPPVDFGPSLDAILRDAEIDATHPDAQVDANLDGSLVDSGRLDQGVRPDFALIDLGSDACVEDSGEICNDGGFVDAARPDLGDGDLDMGTDGGDAEADAARPDFQLVDARLDAVVPADANPRDAILAVDGHLDEGVRPDAEIDGGDVDAVVPQPTYGQLMFDVGFQSLITEVCSTGFVSDFVDPVQRHIACFDTFRTNPQNFGCITVNTSNPVLFDVSEVMSDGCFVVGVAINLSFADFSHRFALSMTQHIQVGDTFVDLTNAVWCPGGICGQPQNNIAVNAVTTSRLRPLADANARTEGPWYYTIMPGSPQ